VQPPDGLFRIRVSRHQNELGVVAGQLLGGGVGRNAAADQNHRAADRGPGFDGRRHGRHFRRRGADQLGGFFRIALGRQIRNSRDVAAQVNHVDLAAAQLQGLQLFFELLEHQPALAPGNNQTVELFLDGYLQDPIQPRSQTRKWQGFAVGHGRLPTDLILQCRQVDVRCNPFAAFAKKYAGFYVRVHDDPPCKRVSITSSWMGTN